MGQFKKRWGFWVYWPVYLYHWNVHNIYVIKQKQIYITSWCSSRCHYIPEILMHKIITKIIGNDMRIKQE